MRVDVFAHVGASGLDPDGVVDDAVHDGIGVDSAAEALVRQLERLTRLSTRLLQLARIEAGVTLRREPVDLAALVLLVAMKTQRRPIAVGAAVTWVVLDAAAGITYLPVALHPGSGNDALVFVAVPAFQVALGALGLGVSWFVGRKAPVDVH